MGTKAKVASEAKRAELARSLDCFTSLELRALAGITPMTEQAWRKRGVGPAYIVFGREFLYPKNAVADFLRGKTRAPRSAVPSKALL
jgi:hypothetical protein